jgi:hypothetical protein
MTFDLLQMLRSGKPMPKHRHRILAALLDFGACANAAFDNKICCRLERRRTRQLLKEAGIGSSVAQYLRRLTDLERRRPLPGGDDRQFQQVALYREAVVQLSLGILAATADGNQSLDEGICATCRDAQLMIVFRIVMQCQIIDDVLDYAKDISHGLPSFLTACGSLPRALELTRLMARGYADNHGLLRNTPILPLRLALLTVSACANVVIFLGRWRITPISKPMINQIVVPAIEKKII